MWDHRQSFMDVLADTEFVREHAPLVRKVAGRVRAQLDLSADLEDLEAYGFRGLLEARDRFDPTRGVVFSAFAYYRVRGAILDGVRQMAYLPRKAYAQRKAAEALDRSAEDAAFARAADQELRADLAATLEAIDDIIAKTSAAFVISALGQDPEGASAPRADEQLATAEDQVRVRGALEGLPERERALIEGHYLHDRTLEELGESMGISKSWASRLHSRALSLLRDALERA